MPDPDLPFSEAAERNKGPILDVLTRLLPHRAKVLEIASGTGQHAAHMAAARSGWDWQPTEARSELLPVIARRSAGLSNVRPPLQFDVLAPRWPVPPERFDAVLCVNMIHVSPWVACAGLMSVAAQHLVDQGLLVTYGPYFVEGEPTAPSNLAFDSDLRARDPSWGLRRLADVVREAERAGLAFAERVAMPANNLMLVFRLDSARAPGRTSVD